MRPFSYLMFAAAIILPVVALAETCPPTLPQDAVTVRGPSGWRGHSPADMRLTGFGMMGGDPRSMAYLVPESSTKSALGGKITWRHPELWLFCTYDDSAAIQISRKLAGQVCTASYSKAHGAIVGLQVACR
jgi:hypothetical protein